MNQEMKQLLYFQPECVKRLGESVFINMPVYELQTPLEPIYINSELFHTCFYEESSWDNQYNFIKQLFSITLNKTLSNGKQCGVAFVDRQAEDSYGISLAGNEGSGRAYYTGRCFNIKGEKTPLATSPEARFSNGKLVLYDGIWSALIGNLDEFSVASSPVLAILRITISHCIIIRIDENGSLDRLTHLFYRPRPLSAQALKQAASNLGRLEAEKFIHRILHGAWSAGNTSLNGHLIDYDSVCAVKGRQLQFNYTSKYKDNYFGFELLGQMKNLNSLCEHPIINKDKVHKEDVYQELQINFKYHLAIGFIHLMGFEDKELLFERFKPLIEDLVTTFYDLSHYTYANTTQSLFTNLPSVLFNHLFDFSAFFRIIPLLIYNNQFSDALGLVILINSPSQETILNDNNRQKDTIETPIINELKPYLINIGAPCPEDLKNKAHQFIQRYVHVFHLLQNECNNTKEEVIARAYAINEDRFYLFPVCSVEKLIFDLYPESSSELINRFIQNLIEANKRVFPQGKTEGYQANFRLFIEGFSYLLVDIHGTFTIHFCFYPENIPENISSEDVWEIKNNHSFVSASYKQTSKGLCVQSVKIPYKELLEHYSRDHVFIIHFYEIYRNKIKLTTTDLLLPDFDGDCYF